LFLGLGWPQWLTIIGLVGGLLLTFKIMARASVAYARAREERERRAMLDPAERSEPGRELDEGEKR
jgi:hypothetical protein